MRIFVIFHIFWTEIFHIWKLIFHKISEFLRLPSGKNTTKIWNIKNRKHWSCASTGVIKESVFAFSRDFEAEAATRTPWLLLLISHIFTVPLYGDFLLLNFGAGWFFDSGSYGTWRDWHDSVLVSKLTQSLVWLRTNVENYLKIWKIKCENMENSQQLLQD